MATDINGAPKENYNVFDFSGGLNTKYRNTSLNDNEATDILNMDFNTRGAIIQRPGLKTLWKDFGSVNTQVMAGDRGFISFTDIKTGIRYSFIEEKTEFGINIRMYRFETDPPANITADFVTKTRDAEGNVTATNVYPALNTEANPFTFIFHERYLYAINDKDGGFRCDLDNDITVIPPEPGQSGGGFVTFEHIAKIPKGTMALVKKQRLYIAGDPENPDFVYFSAVRDFSNFDITVELKDDLTTTTGAGGIIQLEDNDIKVTGLAEFNSRLLIFKQNHVYSVTGVDSSDDRVDKLNVVNGCIDHRTIARSDNQLLYLSGDGVRAIRNASDEVVESIPLSDKIQDLIDEELKLARSSNNCVIACSKGTKYYLSLKNYTFVFDEILGAWTKYSFTFNGHQRDNEDNQLYFRINEYLHYLEEGKENDEIAGTDFIPIIARYSSPFFSLKEPQITKRFRMIKAFFRPIGKNDAKIMVKTEIDYKDDVKELDAEYKVMEWDNEYFTWDDSSWDAVKEEISKSVRFSGTGHNIRVTFENSEMSQVLSLHGFTLVYKRKRKVR